MDMGSRAFVVLGGSRIDMGVWYLDWRMVRVECPLGPMYMLYIGV